LEKSLPIRLQQIPYQSLNDRQKEAHNFQKVSAALADYGYSTIRLQNDWQGADFIAQDHSGNTFLKIQLKGRADLKRKYEGKDICIAFPYAGSWYMYFHDELLTEARSMGIVVNTESWVKHGSYSWPTPPAWILNSSYVVKL
jgi:hypothetical protein